MRVLGFKCIMCIIKKNGNLFLFGVIILLNVTFCVIDNEHGEVKIN